MARLDSITDELRSDILDGSFAPGERLREVALTERYDCGRAAVRAALVELDSEGIVEREANRGAAVRRVTIDDAIEITEARAVLEGLMAARAAERATPEDRAHLAQIVADMRAAVTEERTHDYSALNGRLHRRLREMSGHGLAAELVINLRNRAAHHHYRLASMPGRPAESLDQHEAIVDAVVAGDGAAATAAMHRHLASVVDVLRSWSESQAER